jgi:DNA-binding beta-propeller fold protein YncE
VLTYVWFADPSSFYPSVNGLVVHPDGSRVYVVYELYDDPCFCNQTYVGVIDTGSNTVVSNVFLGRDTSPSGVAINRAGTRLYVAQYSTNQVTALDLTTNPPSFLTNISTSFCNPDCHTGPRELVVTRSGFNVYVTMTDNFTGNTVLTIDTGLNSVTNSFTTGNSPTASR